MAVIPCDISIICIPNDSDSPISNYSSEAPEQRSGFRSFIFPDSWNKPGCVKLCTSTISQNEADLCALAQLSQCNPHPPGTIYYNSPQSCTCTGADGSSFTYTVPAGTYSGPTQAIADALALAYACLNCSNPGDGPGGPGGPGNPATSFLLGPLPTKLCLETADGYQIATAPTTSGLVWTVHAGALPTGLTLNSTNGVISGAVTVPGSFTFQIRATNAQGNFSQRTYTICVIEISPSSLPAATIGQPYSQQFTATGCTTPLGWTIEFGSLPPGLSLNAFTGLLSGTPTGTGGSYLFAVTVTD